MTLMSEALADAALERTERVRDLVRAVRAHRYAVENPPDGDVTSGINAVLTLDRLSALAEEVGESVGL